MASLDELEDANQLLSEQLESNLINADLIREQVNLAKDLNNQIKITSDSSLQINKANRDLNSLSKQLVDQSREREKLLRSERDIGKDINKSRNIEKSLITEIKQLKDLALLASGREKDRLDDIIMGLEDQKRLNQDNITSLNTELTLSTKINSSFGIGGSLLKGWSTILDKIGIDTNNIAQDTRDQLSDLEREGKLREGFAGKLQGLGVISKNVGKSLMEAISDPLVIGGFLLKKIIDSFLLLDSLAGDTAKQYGTSYENASKLNNTLTQTAATSNNIFITTKGLVEAQNSLNLSLGTNTSISGEILANYTELTKQAGYSVEAATTLSKLGLITGKSSKDLAATYLGQVKSQNIKNGLAINEKTLLNDISNTSKGLLATLSSNPSKLAEAAFEAKKLGSSMKDIESISNSLLDIESSIGAEFEAEVMTGKQLNLEKARYFALTNDIAGVAREINKQGITLNSWGNMNVIQQESIAKSMGMSKDQMGGMLMEQEAISKLGSTEGKNAKEKFDNLVKQVGLEEAKKRLGNDQLADQIASTSTQERFLALTEKLKETFIAIAGPIMNIVSPLLDLVSKIVDPISNISAQFGEWGGMISNMLGPLGTLGTILKGIAMLAIGYAAYTAFASAAVIPVIGPVLGAAAAATIIAAGSSFLGSIKDGQIGADGGLMVSGPKGSIQLDKEDTFIGNKNGIIAGTDLGGGKKESNIQSSTNNEGGITILASTLGNKMDMMINRLDNLIGAVNKGMVVNLDGNRVSQELATPMAINNRRI